MPQYYGAAGISEYDFAQSSSTVSSFSIDLDTNATVSLITGEWAASSETNNFNTRIGLRDSGGSSQSIMYRTWSHGTTGSFGSSSTNQAIISYWNLGAANNTSFTGEHMRTMIWIYNDGQSSIPFKHATVYGRTSWESSAGSINDASFTIKCRTNSKISSIVFSPQAQSFRWHRVNSWSIADGS